MATSFNVNLTLISAVGFRRSSTQTFINLEGQPTIGGFNSPIPLMTTTYTLNGVSQPDIVISGTRILNVSTTTDFYLYPGGTSAPQNIYITNQGDSPLSFVSPNVEVSDNNVTTIINDLQPSSGIIAPGTTATLTVSYSGNELGEFYNYIILLTDADSPQYKLVTKQVVTDLITFIVTPGNITTSTTSTSFKTSAIYSIIPVINGAATPEYVLPITAVLNTSTMGWSLDKNADNEIVVSFNANIVGNTTGTYVSELVMTYGSTTIYRETAVNVNIDYSDDYNLSSWISAPSPVNSVVGVSYDVINNTRYITIGIGAGADGVPEYGLGGSEYLSTDQLNYIAAASETPYQYWAKVYRIPLDGTARTYFSKDYTVKDELGDYASYFGENHAPGSIFIVEDDGYYNITIKMNHLRELPETDLETVVNISNAFYEFSDVDIGGGRYFQLSPILEDGVSTYLFVGFNNQGGIIKYPVSLPSSNF